MSDRPLSRIRQLITLCMLAAAVVTIGLVIAGALTGARPPAPQLASQKWCAAAAVVWLETIASCCEASASRRCIQR